MPEEGAAADVVELMSTMFEADGEQDLDGVMSYYGPDAVLDLGDLGFGTFEGRAAIRAFVADWWATWRGHDVEVQEILDLGRGVVYADVREVSHMLGSDRQVEQRRAWVSIWAQGKIVRVAIYLDADVARAAAERLARDSRQSTSKPSS
jgi:ketosteroid isomerase-like protein